MMNRLFAFIVGSLMMMVAGLYCITIEMFLILKGNNVKSKS